MSDPKDSGGQRNLVATGAELSKESATNVCQSKQTAQTVCDSNASRNDTIANKEALRKSYTVHTLTRMQRNVPLACYKRLIAAPLTSFATAYKIDEMTGGANALLQRRSYTPPRCRCSMQAASPLSQRTRSHSAIPTPTQFQFDARTPRCQSQITNAINILSVFWPNIFTPPCMFYKRL